MDADIDGDAVHIWADALVELSPGLTTRSARDLGARILELQEQSFSSGGAEDARALREEPGPSVRGSEDAAHGKPSSLDEERLDPLKYTNRRLRHISR